MRFWSPLLIWLAPLAPARADVICRAPDPCDAYVVINPRGEPITLTRARFVGADYVIAGTAPELTSRFGHAMLRLKFCGPGQDPCRADELYGIDVGFAALADADPLSAIGGVLGRYPSRLIANADLDLRTQYNEAELRDLRSYPLALDDRAKDRLLAEVARRFWSSAEPYRFFDNNCAGGLLDLLRAVLPADHPLNGVSRWLLAPRGLLEYLRAFGLAGRIGGRWRSRRPALEARMGAMHPPGGDFPRTVESYANARPVRRRAWVDGVTTLADLMVLTRLERFTLQTSTNDLTRAVTEWSEREPGRCPVARDGLLRAFADVGVDRLKSVAGVPVAGELIGEDEVRARLVALNQAVRNLIPCFIHRGDVRHLEERARGARENLIRARARAAEF